MEYVQWFLTIGGLVVGTIYVSELINRALSANSSWSWFFSALVGQAMSFIGWKVVAVYLHFGLFLDTATFIWQAQHVALVGAVTTLVANRVFDLESGKTLLRWLGVFLPAATTLLIVIIIT